jgi:hypothetical protein
LRLVSCPHTHQQNGTTECKHRHVIEMGLALLAQSSRLLKYWDQAFLTAVHHINHTPTKILDYDTPIHCLLCATPDYSNLKVFGCACWPNLRPYNAHKLQFCSIHCAFLGYSNLHKGYKCLDIATGRVTGSCVRRVCFSFCPTSPKFRRQIYLRCPPYPRHTSKGKFRLTA